MSTTPRSTTPRTDSQAGWSIANQYGQSTSSELLTDSKGIFVHAVFARQLETELASLQARAEKAEAELARLRADNLIAHQMTCAAALERDRLRAWLAAMKEASK